MPRKQWVQNNIKPLYGGGAAAAAANPIVYTCLILFCTIIVFRARYVIYLYIYIYIIYIYIYIFCFYMYAHIHTQMLKPSFVSHGITGFVSILVVWSNRMQTPITVTWTEAQIRQKICAYVYIYIYYIYIYLHIHTCTKQ